MPLGMTESKAEMRSVDLKSKTLQLMQGDPSKTVGIVKAWLHEGE
jgi:hypothetical protein